MGLDEVKTYAQILFPSNWQIELPFLIPPIDATSSEWFVKMLDYSIVGLTWHDGGRTTGGHYRTLLRQGDKWFHYDDNCLPEIITSIPPHTLQRLPFIWMIRLEGESRECQGCHLLLISLAATAHLWMIRLVNARDAIFNFYELAFDGCRVASINHCQDVKELS